MNKLLQLLFVTSLLNGYPVNAYPDIPDELTGEMLKEMPAEVLDEFLDELKKRGFSILLYRVHEGSVDTEMAKTMALLAKRITNI